MRFAHLSDIHLGFQRREPLQEMERGIFEGILERCASEGVDFVVISGDMFHVNIPEMRVQKYAFSAFRRLREAGIPAYVVYGSHDFSPVSNSVIDLLESTGYITKVTSATDPEGKIRLGFVTDPGTGAKLCGLPGLKHGRDAEYYENLDREHLEREPGFKVFVFHGAITEMREGPGDEGDHMSLSMLPRGFAYYAGGHLHNSRSKSFEGYPHVAYPGTPFAGHYPDLAANAKGAKRGFYMVEFDDVVTDVRFVETDTGKYEQIPIKAKGKTPESINKELREWAGGIDPAGKIVIIDIGGEMTRGKTAEVDTGRVADGLYERGAKAVEISRNLLTSSEYSITGSRGASRAEIEEGVFAENSGQLRFRDKGLVGEAGAGLAKRMLARIGQPRPEDEPKAAYEARMAVDGLAEMGVDSDDP